MTYLIKLSVFQISHIGLYAYIRVYEKNIYTYKWVHVCNIGMINAHSSGKNVTAHVYDVTCRLFDVTGSPSQYFRGGTCKRHENLQDSHSSDRDFNTGFLECERGLLPNLPRCAFKVKNEWSFNFTPPLYVSVVWCFGTGIIYLLDPFTSGRTNYVIAFFVWLSGRMPHYEDR
jgi:hypothetical protein